MLWLAHLSISHCGMLSLFCKEILFWGNNTEIMLCILGHLKIISTRFVIGASKVINFSFGTKGKVIIYSVPVF